MVAKATTEEHAKNLLSFQYTSLTIHLLPFIFTIIVREGAKYPYVRLIYTFQEGPKQQGSFFDHVLVKYENIFPKDGMNKGQFNKKMDAYCAIPS